MTKTIDAPATTTGFSVAEPGHSEFGEPSFNLKGRDPLAPVALRAYADAAEKLLTTQLDYATMLGVTEQFVRRLRQRATDFEAFRAAYARRETGARAVGD